MTNERIASGLMLQVRRRRLSPDESRWLSDYRAGIATNPKPRRKKSSLLLLWMFLCGFIGAGAIQVAVMAHPDGLKELARWAERITG